MIEATTLCELRTYLEDRYLMIRNEAEAMRSLLTAVTQKVVNITALAQKSFDEIEEIRTLIHTAVDERVKEAEIDNLGQMSDSLREAIQDRFQDAIKDLKHDLENTLEGAEIDLG